MNNKLLPTQEASATVDFPSITIVTPSFNQGQYIEDTILSVINQDYPNFEYIIIDGGSSDKTVSIIEKYSSSIESWSSEPDHGQADAINKNAHTLKASNLNTLNMLQLWNSNVTWSQSDQINIESIAKHTGKLDSMTHYNWRSLYPEVVVRGDWSSEVYDLYLELDVDPSFQKNNELEYFTIFKATE